MNKAAKPTNEETKIAGDYTVANWKAMKEKLEAVQTRDLWEITFKNFFKPGWKKDISNQSDYCKNTEIAPEKVLPSWHFNAA